MILGIGSDLVNVDRIKSVYESHGQRFLDRCFTEQEIKFSKSRVSSGGFYSSLAKRFAAKEACVKALGTGFVNGIYLKDIGVVNNRLGKPEIILQRQARSFLFKQLPEDKQAIIHLTLTDEPPVAGAFVIVEIRDS